MFLDYVQKYLLRVVTIVLQIVVFALLIRFFVLSPAVVNGQSMEPLLKDSDMLIVLRINYLFRQPERFEIVEAIRPDNGVSIVKRVIGLPNETLVFRDGMIYIITDLGEEVPIDEPYAVGQDTNDDEFGDNEVVIPENSYFLMGDNRSFSTDSRTFGPVHRKYIQGKILFASRWGDWFRKQ